MEIAKNEWKAEYSTYGYLNVNMYKTKLSQSLLYLAMVRENDAHLCVDFPKIYVA